MPAPRRGNPWKTLDRDLDRISRVELGTAHVARPLVGLGVGLAFIVLAGILADVLIGDRNGTVVVITATVFGAYMAMNIGANDVANNMGPAVGAKTLSMGLAILIAALCETAGALLAGGNVVSTVAWGIVDPSAIAQADVFVRAMMAALVAGALWVNLATWIGAPVSTTHAVVGGVLGAGIAAAGVGVVNWTSVGMILASWVLSPLLGGGLAAMMLAFIKARILYRADRIAAARFWVPVLSGVMAGVFAAYLALQGLTHVATLSPPLVLSLGLGAGLAVYVLSRTSLARRAETLEDRNRTVKNLFALPLVLSAALLSFAHGANDVANAVGPVAAIIHAAQYGTSDGVVPIPQWVMLIGGLGISLGLALFGPRLIRLVGNQITKLNPVRAYCVSLSAALTVILASWFGLPVSSTHIAVGGVFGVGFYREWHMERRLRRPGVPVARSKRIAVEERQRRKLVRRSHFLTVLAAWLITVPAAAAISALVFVILNALAG